HPTYAIMFLPVPPLATALLLFFLSCSRPHRDLHSFPTRRSSDLAARDRHPRALLLWRRPGHAEFGGDQYRRLRALAPRMGELWQDRKSTRLNSSHVAISYAVFCLKKKSKTNRPARVR